MLSNTYFLAKFRFDTAENEPAKNLQKISKNFKKFLKFAISPKSGQYEGPSPEDAAGHYECRSHGEYENVSAKVGVREEGALDGGEVRVRFCVAHRSR